MTGKSLLFAIVLVFFVAGCIMKTITISNIGNFIPQGAMNVSEMLSNLVYDQEVTVYGEISCSCS